MGFKNYIIIYNIYVQVRFSSKAGFFSKLKTRQSDSPQTSNRLAFLAELSVIAQLKNMVVGLVGSQKKPISLFRKWAQYHIVR